MTNANGGAAKAPDEADRQKSGTLPKDPKADAKRASVEVPRVLTMREILEASALRQLSKEKPDALTTGHYRIDSITGGFLPTLTWLFGADTSFGKSSFAVTVVDENMRVRRPCLIVSSEDSEELYGDRFMVRRALVNATRYRDKDLTDEEKERVANTAQMGEALPVFVDAKRFPIEELVKHVATIVREQKIDLVVWDYLQEFKSKTRHQDERVKYREIASQMRKVTKDAKVRGLILSQLTITADTKIPNRHNIRECRDVGNAADVILVGFEPEVDIKAKGSDGRVIVHAGTKCVLVDKVKNGPRGAKVSLSWDSECATFKKVGNPKAERFSDQNVEALEEERYP